MNSNEMNDRSETTELIQTILSNVAPVGLKIAWPTNKVEPGSGDRRTRVLGDTGFDLAKLKEWEPGDRVDGRASAKTGWRDVLSALYEEPRDLTVWVLIDNSPALVFGTAEMNERTLAATLMGRLIGAANKEDLAGVMLYNDEQLCNVLRPVGASRQLLPALYSYLEPQEPAFENDGVAVSGLQQALSRLPTWERCLVFVISPFHRDLEPEELDALNLAGFRHDLVCLTVEDPRERELPEGFGLRELRDLRTGKSSTVWLNRRRRRTWAEEFDQQRAKLVKALGDANASVERFTTADENEAIDLKLVPIMSGIRNQE